ncbi:MAG: hypothetical protein KY467_18525, partial [Gemmatimonadetes bacterium]|nr:hypothetical protein [Gemmatimonadota bacterium]
AQGRFTGVEGTGLWLSIFRDTVEGLGGRAWAEFDGPQGSRFLLAIPGRRSADRERRGGTPEGMEGAAARHGGSEAGPDAASDGGAPAESRAAVS